MNRPLSLNELAQFRQEFGAIQGSAPFAWQERLFQGFLSGAVPSALDLPTGLGKTSVMAIWYLSRKANAPVPRRLVYVVDRRAVVDQATAVAEAIKETSGDAGLRLSTLRGQFVDNREWLADPAAPAIVVGTVDMVGSRLLFSGYGVSAKMLPYHAAVLGADTLVVLDEAHLVPPFEALLKAIARDPKGELSPRSDADRSVVPPFRLMSLSATGREDGETGGEAVFRLTEDDHKDAIVNQRLNAQKKLVFDEVRDSKALADELAKRAWTLATQPCRARVLVYSNSRTDAVAVKEKLDDQLKKHGYADNRSSELLVGGRRVREREALFRWLEEHGFIGGVTDERSAPTFLVATSAGEVGVDLDADHMVCDLVEWERMVQRLGRVNRRGNKRAAVEVIAAAPKEKKYAEEWNSRLARLRKPLDALNGDASPAAIVALKRDEALKGALLAAQTLAPLRPALTRALLDAWSMTSLEEHTGRPDIQPWLRGWVEEEPQTTIIRRRHLPARIEGTQPTKKEINDFFEAAPPQASEMLEAETWAVVEWLIGRAARTVNKPAGADASDTLSRTGPVLLILNRKHELEGNPWTLGRLAGLADKQRKREREEFQEGLTGRTLVVSSLLGGLNEDGMLDEDFDGEPSTIDSDETWQPQPSFRVRATTERATTPDEEWREAYRFAIKHTGDEETGWIVVEQGRNEAQSEESRAVARREQTLKDHQAIAVRFARRLAEDLNLPSAYADMLAIAARLHDEGKRAERWQRAFSAPNRYASHKETYAKTKGPINFKLLDGYRHEFGSLSYVKEDAEFQMLSPELQDLALHIVAAHHGGARPLISTRSCEDAPPSALEERARDVALRFARLQKRWGPWGLAWWEALLRAADQQASRENDAHDDEKDESSKPGEDA